MVTARSASNTCCSETSWRASSGRSRAAACLARSRATLACSTASSFALRSSGLGTDLSSASEAFRPSRVAVFSARSARATCLSSSTIGWPVFTVSPCLTTSSWTCPSTAGVSIASFAGIGSLRPRPSTVSTTVLRRAGSTRTATWASFSSECSSLASAVWLSLWQPASPRHSRLPRIHHRPLMPFLPRGESSCQRARRNISSQDTRSRGPRV